jgi:hypothetical protein
MSPGKAVILFDFAYDGGKLGAGGLGTLSVDGKQVAQGRIDNTNPLIFSPDETADVGVDEATPVTDDYKAVDNKFTGEIYQVTIAIKPMTAGVRDKVEKADQQLLLDKAAED